MKTRILISGALLGLLCTTTQAQIPTIVKDISPSLIYVYGGQGVKFTASFSGSQPIVYQWQHAGSSDLAVTNIPNATNTSFTVPSAALADTGYYELQASNSVGVTLSSLGELDLLAGTPTYLWSAPISFAGLNAEQILTNFPANDKIAGALVAKNGGNPITVTLANANNEPVVFAGAGAWASLSGGAGYFTGVNTNLTGNANFDSCLNDAYTNNATHAIRMSGLTVGQQYQVQLFGLDDRSGLSPVGSSRLVNWQNPADATDIGETFAMADNVYMLGTFTATNTVMTIQQNMLDNTNGNFNCLVLRAVGWNPPPYFTRQPVDGVAYIGSSLALSGLAAGDSTVPSPTITYQWVAGPAGGPYTNLVEGAKYAGTQTTTLTISNLVADDGTPVYVLIASNGGGSQNSREVTLLVQPRTLVGEWLNSGASLADVSGFSLATNHGAFAINGGSVVFTNDAPPGKTGVALYLPVGNTGLAISNSSTLDGTNYDKTFDNAIQNAFTVSVWGRGFPAAWNPFVSKWGEGRPYASPDGGWQLRADGNAINPCFTVRDEQIGTFGYGCNTNDATDDMATTLAAGNDGGWHFYTGTYNASTGERDLYVDGVLAAQETNNVLYDLAPYAHVCIGAKDNPPGNSFSSFVTNNVEIYDVRIYNYDLSQAQITALYGVVPVVVNSQPQSTSQFTNLPAKFVAGIGGTQPVKYQWQLNGTNIQSLPDSANFTGANSNVLTILSVTPQEVGSYQLIASNVILSVVHQVITQPASLAIAQPALVGQWVAGANNFADVSGYTPAGTHDGVAVGALNYTFDTDVPSFRSGYSLSFPASSGSGVTISNSSTSDPGYVNTYDGSVSTFISVSLWAKGTYPAYNGWPVFLGKNGEYGGWKLRWAQWGTPCFTLRDNGAGTMFNGNNGGWDGNDDMAAASGLDGNWHLWTGTYNSITGYRALYIDGNLTVYETGNHAYNTATAAHVTINCQDDNNGSYSSYSGQAFKFYDMRIYNYELTPAEVQSLYSTLPPTTPAQIGTQPPTNITTYCEGITVQIHATSGGGLPLTNQWTFNGNPLSNGTLPDGAVISGANTPNLTIANVTTNEDGLFAMVAANAYGSVTSSNATLTVGANAVAAVPAETLVGAWATGTADVQDHSGYSPAGTHDGYGVNGSNVRSSNYTFSSDVPPVAPAGALSLYLNAGNTAIAISNSSTADAGYTNTFDDNLANAMTVEFWAKGVPGGWSGWLSKHGDVTGWQVRVNNSLIPDWTMQDTGGTDISSTLGNIDNNWHHYAGTFDVVSGVRSLYVDGQLAATASGSGTINMAQNYPVCIGAEYANNWPDYNNYAPGAFFTGKIYGVKIYKAALTQAQVNHALVAVAGPPTFSGGAPVVKTGPNGPQFVLTWSGGTLLSATNVAGPFLPVAGATSPYTNILNSTTPDMFFILSNP